MLGIRPVCESQDTKFLDKYCTHAHLSCIGLYICIWRQDTLNRQGSEAINVGTHELGTSVQVQECDVTLLVNVCKHVRKEPGTQLSTQDQGCKAVARCL